MPATLPNSFFVAEGDALIATELARGPWRSDLQHGGPPAALIARAVERCAGPLARVARLSIEFVRPIPIAPLRVEAAPVRSGKKVQVLGASLTCEGREVARATAVCVRRARVPVPPERTGALPPPPPAPGLCPPFAFPFFVAEVAYHRGIEMRHVRGEFGNGDMAVWMRLCAPIVAGETPSAVQRAAAMADSGNGVSAGLDLARYTFVNADLTLALFRDPEGEWLCLDSRTSADPGGTGIADTALFDERGPVGRGLQMLVVEERGE